MRVPHMAPNMAMVLAAGQGTRMRPLSDTIPKPLIRVLGRPLIDYCLDGLAAVGASTAVVNVHYLADQVEAHLAGRLETGGGVKRALPLLGDEAFFVRNSDSFWLDGVRPNLAWLADAWDEAQMDIALLVASTVRAIGYTGRGDFFLHKNGRLSRRPERQVAPFVYAGAAILHPRLFADTPDGAFSLNLLFDRAIEAGRLHGVQLDGLWINVENPQSIAAAERAISASAA